MKKAAEESESRKSYTNNFYDKATVNNQLFGASQDYESYVPF